MLGCCTFVTRSEASRPQSTASASKNIAPVTFTAAVERAAQIISEAAKALPRDYLARYSEAPWTSIVGIGNVLRHEYQRLDDRLLWEIATIHLPALEPVVQRMIGELEAE